MGLRISTNLPAISAARSLGVQQQRSEKAFAQLSSGNKITKAADDAAGLAISESLRGQVRGIKQARTNAFNAISMVQVSEGGLNEISNIMIRLRELGVQAASDNVGEVERGFISEEAKNLIQEADRIASSTRFGNKVLLDGSGEEMEFHVGAFGGEENVIKFALDANATGSALGYSSISLDSKSGAKDALSQVDESLEKIGSLRANFGAMQSRLETTVSNLDNQYENLSAAKSRIADTDIAEASSSLASAQILQQASVATLAQANLNGSAALRLIG